MTEEYVGGDRRHYEEQEKFSRNGAPMSLVISGSKLPMLALVSIGVAMITSVAYASMWLAKLDDRTIQNAIHTKDNALTLKEQFKIIKDIEHNVTVTTGILNNLADKVNGIALAQKTNEKEDEKWHLRILANEVEDKSHHSHDTHDHTPIYKGERYENGPN